ncbi:hypothetical protein CPB84DRAFT_1793950 [Gymnopilus junonius]|uniref:BTB domain-containing protein n=1 Tax=Gymnopilus junonius TaxID=109634 RepID=A0A9P5TIC7_GYMJU|nr:hypothetical protein CPB84DRAFT_1793950 [Gymnopilus junonius]
MPDEALSTPIVNNQFSAQDADITIQSSDDILFKLHRSSLAATTGAFPGPEINTQEEIVHLTEPAKVLEVIFQYVYPRRHPDLKDLDFDTLLQTAEAVEKYEVFAAMNTCEWRLSEFLPDHAAEILAYSIKHGYPESINKAGLVLSRTPHLDVVQILPSHGTISLLKYQGTRQKIFDDAVRYVEKLPSGSRCTLQSRKHGNHHQYLFDPHVCPCCRFSLLCWITKLSKIRTSSPSVNDDTMENPWCSECLGKILKKILEDGIASVPPFTDFLKAAPSIA